MNEQQQIKFDIDRHVETRLSYWIKDSRVLYDQIGVPQPGTEVMLSLIKLVVRVLVPATTKASFLETMAAAYDAAKREHIEQKTGRRV